MTLRPSLEGVTVSGHACIAVAEGTRGEPLLAILNREGERTKRKQKLLCNDAKLRMARKMESAHQRLTISCVNKCRTTILQPAQQNIYSNLSHCTQTVLEMVLLVSCTKIDLN